VSISDASSNRIDIHSESELSDDQINDYVYSLNDDYLLFYESDSESNSDFLAKLFLNTEKYDAEKYDAEKYNAEKYDAESSLNVDEHNIESEQKDIVTVVESLNLAFTS
jgi:hypothetical protein